ncbi:MAG TPA: hypothetical protein VIO94_12120, partial [Phenylobacterium sp.]
KLGELTGRLAGSEVHSVRPARRVGPKGETRNDLVVEITQTFRAEGVRHRGGATVLFDLESGEARYLIRKRLDNTERFAAGLAFAARPSASLRETYFGKSAGRETFALLHRRP